MAKTLHLRDTVRTTTGNTEPRQTEPEAPDRTDALGTHTALARRDTRTPRQGSLRQTTYLRSGTFRWRTDAGRKTRAGGFLRIRRRNSPDV